MKQFIQKQSLEGLVYIVCGMTLDESRVTLHQIWGGWCWGGTGGRAEQCLERG